MRLVCPASLARPILSLLAGTVSSKRDLPDQRAVIKWAMGIGFGGREVVHVGLTRLGGRAAAWQAISLFIFANRTKTFWLSQLAGTESCLAKRDKRVSCDRVPKEREEGHGSKKHGLLNT